MYNRKSVYCDRFFIMKGKQKTVIKSLPLDAFRTLSTLANEVILKIKHNFCCKMFKVHNKKFLSQYSQFESTLPTSQITEQIAVRHEECKTEKIA